MIIQRKNKPVNRIFGGGILDMFTSAHTYTLPEFHARSHLFGQKHNFTGPKTRLEDRMENIEHRIPKATSKPVDKIDEYSMHHDLDFNDIKNLMIRPKRQKKIVKNILNKYGMLMNVLYKASRVRKLIKPIL